ncbi:sodium-coupled monocarboxylate transporter 1-like [Anopheles merus]|uniref:sodium-coupled monocarboxylate transporter 1-like n=1 Tax=Anopheles merus TaxID=30066 RepID=UPI001BE3E9FB|nr:sodium-coupled monocarboxylate transporter 1-like [Anopheles merus]XP_041787335.1 sodium-coupled monocarboxylate transporter 1-like [Anopheles merus]XP_041787336.1 sodium-coupled monocarboxylate transporter 1-like [Anopheles merus]XP_041787337.1 sodium-coupled monocarboxylate transporter 1-like [Anopheles merus]XP_041787338.1 sodium-coupled monocarboxylate transporter 1-like [Anopheles merus]XP_041787339.1 sodium-coupled monocarboxylate transporter 1-like [Anopheles merus]XP_041787340.1 so
MASYCRFLLVVLLAGVALGQPDSIRSEPTDGSRPTFTVYDYLAVAFMLVISIGIGVFYGWFEKRGSSGADPAGGESSDDFLLGSGMSLFPVTLSLTTSFITAIELLGNPAEMFFSGTQFALIVISMVW